MKTYGIFQDFWSVIAMILFFFILVWVLLIGFPEPQDSNDWGCIGNEKGETNAVSEMRCDN